MKKILYILLFAILGLMISTLIHAALEFPALSIITGDIDKYGDSLVWRNWHIFHGWGGTVLWILGALGGLYLGNKYWRIIYIEKRFGNKRW